MSKVYTLTFLKRGVIMIYTENGCSPNGAENVWESKLADLEIKASQLEMTKILGTTSWKGTASQVAAMVDNWFLDDWGGPSYEGMTDSDVEEHAQSSYHHPAFIIR